MEYKGFTIKQSKNGNIFIYGRNGEIFVVAHKGYLNDSQIKELVDKTHIIVNDIE